MRLVAAILCLYLFGLCVQPALFPLHPKKEKAMSCCSKNKKAEHKGCGEDSDNNCCGDTPCNPFFSQCPICVGIAITANKISFLPRPLEYSFQRQFFEKDEFLISNYLADVLRPPQYIGTASA